MTEQHLELRLIIICLALALGLLIWFHKQAINRLDRNNDTMMKILNKLMVDHARTEKQVESNTDAIRGVHHRINRECTT